MGNRIGISTWHLCDCPCSHLLTQPNASANSPQRDRHNIYSFRFITTYVLLIGLVLLSIVLMTNEYRFRFQQYTAGVNNQRERLDFLEGIEDPKEQLDEVRSTELTGVRAPQRLSLLARGLEGTLPTRVSAKSWHNVYSGDQRLSTNLLSQIFQTPDFVYIITIVTSLLTLLFVFDSVCGEKQQGTLKLLLANAVPRDVILIGKWIGGYISLALPFTVAVLGGLLYIQITGALNITGDDLSQFLAIYIIALGYISVVFTLGLLISSLTHHPSTSLLVSLLVWIGWILVVPNLAPVVAKLTTWLPAEETVTAEKNAVDRETDFKIHMASRSHELNYGRKGEQRAEKIKREGERRKRALDQFYHDNLNQQIQRSQNLARVSPPACFLFAATRLAGTGPELAIDFRAAQRKFQDADEEYNNWLWWGKHLKYQDGQRYMRDENWFQRDALPRFQLPRENLDDRIDAASFDLLLIVLFNVLFFMVSYAAFLRYDVT